MHTQKIFSSGVTLSVFATISSYRLNWVPLNPSTLFIC